MERLNGLAREALSWTFLEDNQRLMWAAVLEFNAVPIQEKGRRDDYACSPWRLQSMRGATFMTYDASVWRVRGGRAERHQTNDEGSNLCLFVNSERDQYMIRDHYKIENSCRIWY